MRDFKLKWGRFREGEPKEAQEAGPLEEISTQRKISYACGRGGRDSQVQRPRNGQKWALSRSSARTTTLSAQGTEKRSFGWGGGVEPHWHLRAVAGTRQGCK